MLKKLLSLSLVALMLVGTLASCALPSLNPSASTTGSNNSQDNEVVESLDIPSTRYDGTELCFLTRDESEWSTIEIFAEEMTADSDNINNAVYERNDRILQDYGVTIKENKESSGKHYNTVSTEAQAPTGDFQAVVSSAGVSDNMASNGLLWDLNSDSI